MTKGALYHHYAGKRELFAAVFSDVQRDLNEEVAAAYVGIEDPWEAFEAGCRAFVEACQEPGVQRIFLLDAPVALGWETIRRLESGSLELMVAGIDAAVGRRANRDRQLASARPLPVRGGVRVGDGGRAGRRPARGAAGVGR